RNTFDLVPYLTALPMLVQHITSVLGTPVLEADWQLRPHCTSCAYLDTCYRQALSTDDVMLTPHLTPGEHLKLQSANRHTLAQAADWCETDDADRTISFNPQQATRLCARLRALAHNRVALLSDTTELYPANISTAVFFHLLRDPGNGQPRVWGLHRLSERTTPDTPHCWIAASEADIPACQQAFVTHLQGWWQEAISAGQGPHLFMFGAASLQCLQDTMSDATDGQALNVLWSSAHHHHTDLRQILRQHFALPIALRVNLATAAHVWGLTPTLTPPPYLIQDEADEAETLLLHANLHAEHMAQLQTYIQTHLRLQQQLWQICSAHLHSNWRQTAWNAPGLEQGQALERDCVTFLEQQRDWRQRNILSLQQCPLPERVERYRALGPLIYQATTLDDEGRFLYHFELPTTTSLARFRVGDFLKLNPLGNPDLQEGSAVILAQYEPHARHLAVVARRGRLTLNARLRYSLDEDIEDWTTPKLLDAVRQACTPSKHPQLTALLAGNLPLQHAASGLAWAQHWIQHLTLNRRQQDALLLPFRSPLGLIEGPPGTGKTHLLAWMLIALILQAQQAGRPLRIVVSALTHQAIDNVLLKIQQLLMEPFAQHFPGRYLKWGRRPPFDPDQDDAPTLTYVDTPEEVLQTPYLILGATGYGLYNLFGSQSGAFPAFFDWVIFDEASQVIIPQAMLSLLYGKGQYIFCGDIKQLPPVILGPQDSEDNAMPSRSILSHLQDTYDASIRVRLNETYRLNQTLCQLPSRLWYQGDLHPTPTIANARLVLPAVQRPDLTDTILSPDHPVTLVLADHKTDHQQSMAEVEIIAALAVRLLLDYGLMPERLAIVAPHRAQNNAIAQHLAHLLMQCQGEEALSLPLIDTVERLQGAERDVILFSLTTSDPDHRDSPFLNSPNRFNVAITRARHKLVVVGSTAFFTQIPATESGLTAHYGFRSYYELCREQNALFAWKASEVDK
ncbi:MAG: AAA domain-containing protein, partial [bacterium]|nr:AAA domain-containing protein [bacterium]